MGAMLSTVRVNAPTAACQVIDGEAVLIHFDTGGYFSSLGSGGEIIRLLELGQTVEQTIALLSERYAFASAQIESSVRAFVDELVEEQLFVPGQGERAPAHVELRLDALDFTPPKLEKYRELEDLLKLDPIHDVDPAGWPLREAEAQE